MPIQHRMYDTYYIMVLASLAWTTVHCDYYLRSHCSFQFGLHRAFVHTHDCSSFEKMEDNESNSSLITLIEVSENESENEYIVESERDERELQIKQNEVSLNNLRRAKRNWRKCLGCDEKENLHRPTKRMRMYFCKSKKVYIQENDRVCSEHLQVENWDRIHVNTASNFSAKIVDEMIAFLLNPKASELGNPDTHVDIGLTDFQFKKVVQEIGFPENPNKTQQRLILSVKLYLERLRHGHTYAQMAWQHKTNRRAIARKVNCGRNTLLQSFIPRHLGYKNLTREWLLEHTTNMARIMYCDNDPNKSVTIWDGTYIYVCNTSNYTHQRKIYSGQKKRHLFKIMKVVAVDGSILDVFGPFAANKNDAEILKTVFEETEIGKMFLPGDVILLDRGFRDCVKFLEKKNFIVKMPAFIKKKSNKQLTTMQDNTSRLVTKMRFAIECANGRMKSKWRLFCKIIPSILTKHLMSDYQIGAAMLNAFGKPIICDQDDYANISQRMINCVHRKNELRSVIRSKSFRRTERLHFKSVDGSQLEFPKLNEQEIKNFALGVYAVKQAISYTAQHMKDGKFPIKRLPDTYVLTHFERICVKMSKPILISTKILSRFRSQKLHSVYVLYESAAVRHPQIHYWCGCQHGQRTIGCCGHVMAVVWYFGFGRYITPKDPASHLNDFFNH